ncbi:MAG: Na+/H+ antiporter subunit E [Rickettsiales bacterium]|nr:Na+/H+ antiporter subunit E [Rickettsiales bacterium]
MIFIILKQEISTVAILESLVFATLTFLINKQYITRQNLSQTRNFRVTKIFVLSLRVMKDILISSWNVSTLVLSKKNLMNISPVIKKITIKSLTKTQAVILANYITSTPGTISFDVSTEEIYIHALKEEYIKDIKNSGLINYIEKI